MVIEKVHSEIRASLTHNFRQEAFSMRKDELIGAAASSALGLHLVTGVSPSMADTLIC